MRTKKIFLNMVCDILPYLLIGVVGIIKMDVLIKYIGDVGNGYYQTINQIISYVFLAQAGFSDAVTYSLYKPFAENNKDNNVDIIDIKLSSSCSIYGEEQIYCFTALIMYTEIKEE